ncbi:titin-like [Anthonomus grandis grandis]|uniref:titin-like n=1 Tax=Anthonomus grandis grandis TaxID=2921223 RepID=UPI002165C321|nr:titin-like [Anthonomus grandis grandis]
MKRPPGLWILLSAGVLWLCLQDVYGIRATALIFGKSTTSTTTEAATSPIAEDRVDSESGSDAEPASSSNSTADSNSTTPTLTGIPQIDYVWDPNLPKELNGYNLSDYPFYERVPDEKFDFKCDGLHDGFYASIPHKCQVYHHCLFGTRYDFLCANYTAFDQKTFICQFVSEVDCENSKKFWHRNDALYQAQSTTTAAPPNLRAAIYTTAPPNGADPVTPIPSGPAGGRKPFRKRRPQVQYYDDEYYDEEYYEERPRVNRGRPLRRPRPRPRPAYEDDYEEYEDERYESRRNNRRRPYRNRRKNKDRRRPAEYDEDEEVDDRFEDEDFIDAPKRPKAQSKRPQEVEKPKRKPQRKPNRRPVYDDEYDEDDLPQSDDSRSYEERPKKNKFRKEEQEEDATSSDGRPIIKSSTGTIYDRPRVAPRINLPVPKNAAEKFSYKALGGGKTSTTTTTTVAPKAESEEYDEIEEPPKRPNRRPVKVKPKNDDSRSQQSASRPSRRKPEVEEVVEKTTQKPKYSSGSNRYQRKKPKPPVQEEEYYDEEEDVIQEEVQERRPSQKYESKRTSTTSTTTTTTTSTTTEAPKKEPIMRIIKRPFLPSRGGDPYSPRGLKPLGLKAVEPQESENESEESVAEKQPIPQEDYPEEPRPNKVFKPSPVIVKVPVRQKYIPPSAEAQELIELEPSRLQNYKSGPRTTQKPKVIEKNPIYDDEYDVTLNDALNPTLPNLPVRAFPTGFSSPGVGDFYTRQRYVLEPVVNQNNYALQNNKVVRSSQNQQRFEPLPQRQTQAIYSRY